MLILYVHAVHERNRSHTVATDNAFTTSESCDIPMPQKVGRYKTESNAPLEHQKNRSVLLEHLLHATHIHGDGQAR